MRLFLLCGFLYLLNGLVAQELILINITQPDDSIGTEIDSTNIDHASQRIAHYTGLSLRRHAFNTRQLKGQGEVLANLIRDLACTPEDVILFYYSGHGLGLEQANPQWPGFRIDTLIFFLNRVHHHHLKPKGPRLLITLFDCCTFPIDLPPSGRIPDFVSEETLRTNYRRLFLETSGDLMIQSNSLPEGGRSYGRPDSGGIFTQYFLETLAFHTSTEPFACSWDWIMKEATKRTTEEARKKNVRQVPRFHSKGLRRP